MPMWFLETSKQNWKTQSFSKSLSALNLLLETASRKPRFLWRGGHPPPESALSKAEVGVQVRIQPGDGQEAQNLSRCLEEHWKHKVKVASFNSDQHGAEGKVPWHHLHLSTGWTEIAESQTPSQKQGRG